LPELNPIFPPTKTCAFKLMQKIDNVKRRMILDFMM